MNCEMMLGTPSEVITECRPSDWAQRDIFIKQLEYFIKFTKRGTCDPILFSHGKY